MLPSAYLVNPPEHRCYGRESTCEACGETRCEACMNLPAYVRTDHTICGECHKRGVEECASCCALLDPEAMSQGEIETFRKTGLCLTCASAENLS